MVIDKLLTLRDRLEKARALAEEGRIEFKRAGEIEKEFEVRRLASCSCEKVFHGFIELTNAILIKHGATPPESHDKRKEELDRIGRSDLADLYSIAKDDLHTSCYYEQRIGTRQEQTIERIMRKINEEIKTF